MEYAKLEREIRLLKAYASGCTILSLASLLGTALQAQNENERFTEIEVERINVVEADGRLALVIANSQRLPGPILRGEELDKSLSAGRTDSAGMIFVDPAGNEVGGLIHRTVIAADDAYTASRSLTFDQHQQDQVVGISYFDNGSIRTAGFNVWDRPTTIALEEIMDSNTPDRQAIEQRFVELMRERGLTSGGARRVFLGSQDKTVALRLMDPEGRERIRISVDSNSNARLEFLDEEGSVIQGVPAWRRWWGRASVRDGRSPMMSRQTPRASGCTSTLRSPASVGLVVSALAAAGCVSKPTLEMFQAASPYVVATARVASQGHPGLSRLIPD